MVQLCIALLMDEVLLFEPCSTSKQLGYGDERKEPRVPWEGELKWKLNETLAVLSQFERCILYLLMHSPISIWLSSLEEYRIWSCEICTLM